MPHFHLKKYTWIRRVNFPEDNQIALFEVCSICGKQRDYFVLETSKNPEWVMLIK